MSKKKSAKTEVSVKSKKYDEETWKEPLETAEINDDYWWCIVTMMVETRTEHARYVSLFNEAAEDGKRKAIYVLSYQKMLANVRSLARQDPQKCSPLQRVCHSASKLFEVNEVSTWLLARVIKYMIYRAKVEVVGRIKKEQELKRAIDEEYRVMQTVVDPMSAKASPRRTDTDRTLVGKANTRLRIREEEWRDIVYVDDAPLDGPNLYVILTGFHDPGLPAELMSIDVPLTCILKIKRPGEKLEHVPLFKLYEENSNGKKMSRFPGAYTVSKANIHKFWWSLKRILEDPETVQTFSNVAFITFKPPFLLDDQLFPSDDLEYEPLKKDIYDRVSFIVYDLYDLLRKHSNYLRSMLIQGYDFDETEEPETNVYRAILDALPTECVTVPTLLHALLLQLEANLDAIPTDRSVHEQKVLLTRKEEEKNVVEKVEPVEAVESIDDNVDAISWLRDKLKLLNEIYNYKREETLVEEKPVESLIEVIPHGDYLRLDTHRVTLDSDIMKLLDPRGEQLTLADAVLQVFHDPRIFDCWEDQEQLTDIKLQEYNCHINNIIKYYEPGIRVNGKNIIHFLHLLAFDEIINGRRWKRNEKKFDTRFILSDFKSLYKIFSEPYLKTYIDESSRFTKSDSQIDYGNSMAVLSSCPALFGLVDPREIILPGYLANNINGEQCGKLQTPRELLEEYEDVELLPQRVLLQTFYECFQYFERFERRYFEATDSMLLYFSNDYVIGDVAERLLVSRIRTPVCLRDFVRFVLKEETDWLGREEERYRLESIDRASTSTIDEVGALEDFRLRFTDEHFILPNSLKARDMKKLQISLKQQDSLLVGSSKKGAKAEEKEKVSKLAGKERKGKTAPSEKISLKSKKREANGIDTSFLPRRKILSQECAKEGEPHEFVGYDLGNLRVQLTEKRKIFYSADGTLVRVNLERWLYEKLNLRIDVNLHNFTLHLFDNFNDLDTASHVFHFTTEEGIVLAFSKRTRTSIEQFFQSNYHPGIDTETEKIFYQDTLSTEDYWKRLDFDFSASWPSGLTILPVMGDTVENPFYIRQSYISKGPEDVAGEVYRKFLRNGTVLKFLDDNRVIVLRPNGTVVECTDFEDSTQNEKQSEEDDSKKKMNKEKETGRMSRRKRKNAPLVRSRHAIRSIEEEDQEEMDEPMSQSDIRGGMRSASTRIKVTGYNVLDHDGRRYEVLRDLVVREYDRLPVRASLDYELGENFVRRSDGTDMLFRSNGELIVHFTDGTRITTGYVIEEEPLICDWTRDEFERYFRSIKLYEYGDRSFSNSQAVNINSSGSNNNNSKYYDDKDDDEGNELSREESSIDESRYEDEMTRILIAESFVSVLLTCRLEHKNYASVSYDQSAVSCTLSMPADLRVSISRRGHYEVSAPGKVNLKIEPNGLIFTGEMCATCAGRSATVYNFRERSGPIPETIFTSTDIFGNVFEVKSDGTTSYRPCKSRERSSRKFDLDENDENDENDEDDDRLEELVEMSDEEEEKDEEEEEEGDEEREREDETNDHVKYCLEYDEFLSLRRGGKDRRRYRIFSMNRDFTAHEYIHRSVRNEEEATVFNDEACVIQHPVSVHRSNLCHLITLVPLETGLRSKALLQSYLIPKVGPTNVDRRDFLRSTYSIPYDWLFPFGRNGYGMCSDTYDIPLAKTTERQRPPKTLRLRILHGFKEPDRNAIIDLKRAMARYCQNVLDGIEECREFVEIKISDCSNVEDDDKAWTVANIREFALGIRKNIDFASYLAILQQQRRGVEEENRREAEQTSRRLAEMSESRRSNEIQLEWYRRCMREKIILPYFENVTGSCFLLVKECFDRVFPAWEEEEEEEEKVEWSP